MPNMGLSTLTRRRSGQRTCTHPTLNLGTVMQGGPPERGAGRWASQ